MRLHRKAIKIAHVTFDMRIGGAERVISELVKHTDGNRYKSSIVCLEGSIGPFGRQLAEIGIPVITLGRKPGFDVSLIFKLRSYVKNENIAILHCHQYSPFIYGLLASLGSGAKVIFTEHGRFYPDQRKLKRIILNPILSCWTNSITAISKATRDALIKYENFPRDNIEIIYNGIEDYLSNSGIEILRRELNIPENAFILGTVSRLDPIKNHPLMLRALRCLLDISDSIYLLIIGDGPEKDNLERLSKELGIESNVIFTGFREDVRSLYPLMDVFLLTSFSEGTAMTLLEAFAAGLPCVVTNVGGNPEIVLDKRTGFVIPSDDVEALVNRIVLLFGDEGKRRTLGRAARERYEKHFSINCMVKKYTEIYNRLSSIG